MLQRIKAATCRGAHLAMEVSGVSQGPEGSTAVQKTAKKRRAVRKQTLKKPSRSKPLVSPKQLELSVTISVGDFDIDIACLKKMQDFLETECISGLCSIGRGGALSRLRLQMVCQMMASSATVVSKRIKTHLGWDKPGAAPMGHHILTKTLRNTGLHTFIGMLGYCIKDQGEDHFDCVHHNVTDEQMKEGVEEYVKYGTPFTKNRVILTHQNVIEKAATFYKFKQLGSTLPGTLLPMLQSGQYIPSTSWVSPVCQGGIDYSKAAALWKCMMQPDTMNMDDVTQIFFEHTTPVSCVADLEQQTLAATLDEAQEGVQCDYEVPGTHLVFLHFLVFFLILSMHENVHIFFFNSHIPFLLWVMQNMLMMSSCSMTVKMLRYL